MAGMKFLKPVFKTKRVVIELFICMFNLLFLLFIFWVWPWFSEQLK